MRKLFPLLLTLVFSQVTFAKDIYFEIPDGTADLLMDWNSPDEPVLAQVGDTLIIKNGDSRNHQLHTSGSRPCGHGDLMKPGETWSCVLETEYNAFEEAEPTRDHLNYDLKFWIVVGS